MNMERVEPFIMAFAAQKNHASLLKTQSGV
jgi:hypothetical protein